MESPFDPNSVKLAQQIAMRIEEDIISSGWKVGEMIGSEAELAARYHVSRWVIREAISITEQDGLVEVRRGRRGGIAVSAPAMSVVGSSIRRFLSVSRVTPAELYEARFVLENFAARLAILNLDKGGGEALRRLADRAAKAPRSEHQELVFSLLREVLSAAGNSAVEVFVYALFQVTSYRALLRGIGESDLRRIASRLIDLRIELVEAILAGDLATAGQSIEKFLGVSISALLKTIQRQSNLNPLSARYNPGAMTRSQTVRPKLTEQIAWQIECDINAHDGQPGRILGSEAQLMERYRVSRSVIREAIRPLERLGAVEMCRGKHSSGLKVTEPNPSAIVRSVVLYLNYSGNNDFTSYELRKEIERVVVSRLAGAPREARRQVATLLREFAERRFRPSLTSLRQVVHQLGELFAQNAENRILSFFLRILAETVLISSRCTLSASDAASAIRNVQAAAVALADAIDSGAPERAQRSIDTIWDSLRKAYDLPKRRFQRPTAAA